MNKKKINVRLTYSQVESLFHAYEAIIEYLKGTSDLHRCLLKEHAICMQRRISEMYDTQQTKYTLKMNSVEAMAFYQMWLIDTFPLDAHAAYVVQKVFSQIDQTYKSLKAIGYAD